MNKPSHRRRLVQAATLVIFAFTATMKSLAAGTVAVTHPVRSALPVWNVPFDKAPMDVMIALHRFAQMPDAANYLANPALLEMFEKSNESYLSFKQHIQGMCISGKYNYVLRAT